MKQYVFDQLRLADYQKIKTYLDKNLGASEVEGLYWIPVEENILNDIQKEHTECQPFYFCIELQEDQMSCELLVRTKNKIRCNCIAYATKEQRNWLIELMDAILEKLEIQI